MTVYELSRDQLDELKEHYFWGEETVHIPKFNHLGLPALFAGDIPDNVIFDYYAGIDFVNDDFCCTAEKITYNPNNCKMNCDCCTLSGNCIKELWGE